MSQYQPAERLQAIRPQVSENELVIQSSMKLFTVDRQLGGDRNTQATVSS